MIAFIAIVFVYKNEAQIIGDFNPDSIYEKIIFTSMDEIDAYFQSSPDLSIIEGDVILKGPKIKDLHDFSGVRFVTGYIKLINTEITDFVGLENLEGCMGFFIEGNLNLKHITNIKNLEQFYLFDCYSNQKLELIDSVYFPNMVNWINIHSNDILQKACCFDNIDTVESMFFHFNHKLSSLPTFQSLTKVKMRLSVIGNDNLVDLTGLENLKTIGGSLLIKDNKSLKTIEHLMGIEYIDKLELWNNDSLVYVSKFKKLQTIAHELSVISNSSLENIEGFLNVLKSGCKVQISWNPKLSECPFSNIKTWKRQDVIMIGNGGNCSEYKVSFNND